MARAKSCRPNNSNQTDHAPYPVEMTSGQVRASDVRDVLIYCCDHRCGHHVETNADGWARSVQSQIASCASEVERHGLPKSVPSPPFKETAR